MNSTSSVTFVNIAAYKFVRLDDIAGRKASLLPRCRELELKGSILLSNEGINMFLAGTRENIDTFLVELRSHEEFEDIKVKESFCDHQPFSRMLVRLKKEIISMGVETIQPDTKTSPKISATELKQWLDEGRDLTLLDVRNDYEVKIGTFTDAMPIGVDHFRQFPAAVDGLDTEMKKKPVVMFCTGGIRCEKAGPLMEEKGFSEVYQLDGGILKYFEDVGGEHYDGECFVFDKRVAVDAQLQETNTQQCYLCQAVLTTEEQHSEFYVAGECCQYCYKTPVEKMEELTAERNFQLAQAVSPLPGSQPYENVRPLNVPLRFDRCTVLDFLDQLHPHVGREHWSSEIQAERIVYKKNPLGPNAEIRSGWRIEHLLPGTIEPDVNADIRIVFENETFIAVDKPAPLPMHPSGRFNRNSLTWLLSLVYTGQRLRCVHRLDANTTGIVIICRKRTAADFMRVQFERGDVHKKYLARVKGQPAKDDFACDAAISTGPEAAGGRRVTESDDGLPARTEFNVLKRYDDGTSLIECHPKTGRTNQIRIHLSHLGFPIVGDPMYLAGGDIVETQTKSTSETTTQPMCLHAWKISFLDPETKERIELETQRPTWAGPTTAQTGEKC